MTRDYDFAVAGSFRPLDQRIVAVEYPGLDHRIAGNLERVMIARTEQGCGNSELRRILERLDRNTGGDAAVQRQFDDIVGDGGRAGRGARREGDNIVLCCLCAAFGIAHHFERTRPVRQPLQEPAFLKGADQPVHTRLGLEAQRFLHLLEGRGNAGFGQPVFYEANEFVLFAGKHAAFSCHGTFLERLGNIGWSVKRFRRVLSPRAASASPP